MASESSIPSEMRAWIVTKTGNPRDVLKLHADFPAPPAPTGSDILIQIDHAALNPADIALSYILPTWLPFRRRPIAGCDFAGTVRFAGPSTPAELGPGAEVCGCLGHRDVLSGKGTLAEYILVDSASVAARPQALSSAAAAGLGMAGQTVAVMLEAAKVKSGDRVLVNGGSGGVGSFAVQVAKGLGAHVTATCSQANVEMVKKLGADTVVDYRAEAPVHAYFEKNNEQQPFDYILDTIRNQQLYEASPKYLKPKGLYVNIGAHGSQWDQWTTRLKNGFLPTWLGGTPRKWLGLGLLPTGDRQRMVCKWVADGFIDVPIDSKIAFEDVRQVSLKPLLSMFDS